MADPLTIAGKEFSSRLFLGTGKFSSGEVMSEALATSGTELVTVALRRVDLARVDLRGLRRPLHGQSPLEPPPQRPFGPGQDILSFIDRDRYTLLPNTSGARNAREALLLARLAREAGLGNWVKLEVIPDPQYLFPDPLETLIAAEELVREGFVVLPYLHADPVLAKRLADVGSATVMPLAAPIGSARGLRMKEAIRIIIEQATVPVVVDAGLGIPSHACEAMEMGADAVLVNTAIATAEDPVAMAEAFRLGVEAGRKGFLAGRVDERDRAESSSPLVGVIR